MNQDGTYHKTKDLCKLYIQSKEKSKDHESIQTGTTPDQEHHIDKTLKNTTHKIA